MSSSRTPSLKALRAFDALSRHMHVAKAASELNVTASAISHLTRRLEADLDVKLVQKSGRNIELTELGTIFAPRIQNVFRDLARSIHDIKEHTNPNILTISLRPYFTVKWLSPRLSRFWLRHPDIELRLIHTINPVDFDADRADLAIEWAADVRSHVNFERLIPGELTPVCSPQMPNISQLKTAADLHRFTLLTETDHNSWEDWFKAAGMSGYKSKQVLVIDDANVRYQAAKDGQGVELSCKSLIQEDINAGVLLNPITLCIDTFAYYLVTPTSAPISSARQKFIDWLKQEVALTLRAHNSG